MNNKIQELFKDSLNVKITQGFIIISFIFLAVMVWKWGTLPPEIPLYYSLPRGIDQLGSPLEFMFLPLFSTIIFIIHFTAALFIISWGKLAAKILLISAFVASVALLLTFIKIVLLIT